MTLLLGQLLTSSKTESTRRLRPAQGFHLAGWLIFRNLATLSRFAGIAAVAGRDTGAVSVLGARRTPRVSRLVRPPTGGSMARASPQVQPPAGGSSTVTLVIFTSSAGRSPGPVRTLPIRSTTSVPSVTRPKME